MIRHPGHGIKAMALVALLEDGTKRTFLIRGQELDDATIDTEFVYRTYGQIQDILFKIRCHGYTEIDGVPGQDVFREDQKALEEGIIEIEAEG